MKQVVVIPRGIQGSGKSTWASKWVSEDPTRRIRINQDSLRRMFGPYWIPPREPLVASIKWGILKEALRGGFSVVIDNMNLSEKEVGEILKIAKSFMVDVEFKEFFLPLSECKARNSGRQGDEKISAGVLEDTYKRHSGAVAKTYYRSSETGEICYDPDLWKTGNSGKKKKVTMDEVATEVPIENQLGWIG